MGSTIPTSPLGRALCTFRSSDATSGLRLAWVKLTRWNRFKGEVMHFLENVFLDLPSPRTDAQDEEFHVRLSRFCRAKITKEGGFGWCYSGNIDGFGPAKYVDEVVSVFSDGEWTEYEVVRRRRTQS